MNSIKFDKSHYKTNGIKKFHLQNSKTGNRINQSAKNNQYQLQTKTANEDQNLESWTTRLKLHSFIRSHAPCALRTGWSAGKTCFNATSSGIRSIWSMTPGPIKKPLEVLGTTAKTALFVSGASLLYQGLKSLQNTGALSCLNTALDRLSDYAIKPVLNSAAPLVVSALNSTKHVVQQAVIDTATDAALTGAPLAINAAVAFGSGTIRLGANLAVSIFSNAWETLTDLDYRTQACLVSAVGGVVFAKYYALPQLRRFHQGPPLPRWIYRADARRVTPLSRVIQNLKQRVGRKNNQSEPILNENVRNRIETIVEANRNILKNRGYFKNILLLGGPGTGKTMLAQKIAQDSNFNYIQMSGADFAWRIQRGDALECFNELLQFARESTYPTVLLIDEIDALCPNGAMLKNSEPSRQEKEFRSAFLSAIGKSNKLLLIGTTNYEQDIDTALLSRFNQRIEMELPDCNSRTQILTQYIDHYLGKNIPERMHCLNAKAIEELGTKTEGMSGRSLFQFVDALVMHRPSTADGVLTTETIQEILGFYLEDLKREEKSKEAKRQKEALRWAAEFGVTPTSAPPQNEFVLISATIQILVDKIAILEKRLESLTPAENTIEEKNNKTDTNDSQSLPN